VANLFVVNRGNVSTAIPIVEFNDIVIALDFWSAKQLRDKNIVYGTPYEYVDNATHEEVNAKAIELAQTWYKHFPDKLFYKNISLGQMAEHDFGYIFIETIRAIALAERILSEEDTRAIYLPPKMAGNSCYRMLPRALMAMNLHIPIFILKHDIKSVISGKIDSLVSISGFILRGMSYALGKCLHNVPMLFNSKGKNIVFFVYVPVYKRICNELDKTKNACLEIFLIQLPAISKSGRKAVEEVRSFKGNFYHTMPNNFYYKGISLTAMLHDEFRHFFDVKAPALIGYIEWAERITKVFKPKAVVVFEDATTLSRTYCRAFKNNGVPVLVIQHGAVMERSGIGMHDFLICPLEASVQAVWGEIGVNEKQGGIGIVTGNPQYDFVHDGFNPNKLKTCHKLRLDPEKGIIVVATEWYNSYASTHIDEVGERFIRYTLRALKKFPDKQIVIKLHPTFNKKYGEIALAIAKEENVKVTITASYLWELLDICDLVIVTSSTVGLDAMIVDKPVVVVNLEEQPDAIAYVPSAAKGAYNIDGIAPVVSVVLNNQQLQRELVVGRKKFIYKYAYIQDGKASYRVAELISQMIKK